MPPHTRRTLVTKEIVRDIAFWGARIEGTGLDIGDAGTVAIEGAGI